MSRLTAYYKLRLHGRPGQMPKTCWRSRDCIVDAAGQKDCL